MGAGYRAISWNPQKRRYDLWLAGCLALALALFVGLGAQFHPQATIETLLIRGTAVVGFLLLSLILSLGPLARFDARCLPLLYNRRHMGVSMFLLALAHAGLAVLQHHGLGVIDPLTSLLVSNPRAGDFAQFPFEWLGLAALLILFLMAASSHDFWLALLGAPRWKRLHLLVHLAYWLIVGHVALGALSVESRPWPWWLLGGVAMAVAALQIAAGLRERRVDREPAPADWIPVGAPDSIPAGRARVIEAAGERVAVFRDGQRFFALSNVCQHQNGPLGEGRVRNGCAVCPWHGYEYELETGCSPPPYSERVPQFQLRLRAGLLELDPRPLPAGSRPAPVQWVPSPAEPSAPEAAAPRSPPSAPFYVGYEPRMDPGLARALRWRVALLLLPLLTLAGLAGAFQPPISPAGFDFGAPVELSGLLRMQPVPHLLVPRPGAEQHSSYLLVAPFKHGLAADSVAFDGRQVSLRGALAYRGGATLVEVVPGSIASAADNGASAPLSQDLGPQTLRGEIVDSKCFLGVMRPGELKPHRACASLCIRGGIPPVLCVRRADGSVDYWVLVGPNGEALNQRVLGLIAEPVEIKGHGHQRGSLRFLHADPSDIRRL
jgi:methionine sulfoxide reductase heme-binding subunit